MRYRVVFTKRLQSDGADLGLSLAEGVVLEKQLVIPSESEAPHVRPDPDRDDGFVGAASPEVWDYWIADGCACEFECAADQSEMVLEYDIIDSPEAVAFAAPAAQPDETLVDLAFPESNGAPAPAPSQHQMKTAR